MTTQTDFQNLVTRIGVATDKLEVAVTAVEGGTEEVTQAVVQAQAAATQSTNANTQAQLAKTAAGQSANSAAASANTATQKATEAVNTVNDLMALAPFQEAPKDGKTYGRNNAAWVEVASGGGGAGTVQSVNGKSPNTSGEVTLTNTDVGAAATVHTHSVATTTEAGFMSTADKTKLDGIQTGATAGADWNTNVANKPTIPTQGITSIQAGSNITIDNTNPLSPKISASGGGGTGFPTGDSLYYDSVEMTTWRSLNPNDAIDFTKCGAWISGRWVAGGALLIEKGGLDVLASGNYFFSSIASDIPNIVGSGVAVVTNGVGTSKNVKVVTFGNATSLPQEYYPVIAANNTVTWRQKTDNPKFLFPQFENGWEYNFGTSGSPIWVAVDYWPIDFNHSMPMAMFRRRGSPYAGGSSSLPSTGQDGLPINWNQMFTSSGYIQYVPPGKYWFTASTFSNSTGGATLNGKTGFITVEGSNSGVGTKRAVAVAYDATTNIPTVLYWKSDGTWNKAT